jgi:hypothetical protein
MNVDERINRLDGFRNLVETWRDKHDRAVRRQINEEIPSIRREVLEAGCYMTMTIGPPPAVGGLIMQDVDAFAMMFNPPYGIDLARQVLDMIDKTIGVLKAGPLPESPRVQVDSNVEKGYVFIAMPMPAGDAHFEDVLDATKEACKRCGFYAERVDDDESNERITDRMLESIRRAEFVIVDLTRARPNVFYEAGYAAGLGKTPIYIATAGTPLEFDLKDYPVIFFNGMKDLKDRLETRLRTLAKARVDGEDEVSLGGREDSRT